ncbi:MAG: glycosyltransferase family 39 protein [Anaerolineae bacterium]|nr:glycosyltransferase family 39 protein [Anaerolineae bacterium]
MTGQTQIKKFKSTRWAGQTLALMLLVLLYGVVALGHAYLAPLTTGPDELAHYEYVRFIAEHGQLPQNYQEREQASYKSDQPPLYHLLIAIPVSLVDPTGPPFLKRVYDHPRRQLIERTRHSWGLYNTEDELRPYRAEVLRWQIGRWVAILFGAATVVVTFFMARELFTILLPPLKERKGIVPALGAAAIVAFVPRFVLTGSMLNYETMVAFWTALYLWLLLRLALAANGRPAWWRLGLLGLLMGLAITTKLSAIILPVETLVAFWLIERYALRPMHPATGQTWRGWWRKVLPAFVVAGLVISFWFGFVVYQFNTVTKDGWWAGLLRPLIAADASDATTNRLLSALTGGQAGFTAAIENLDSGPPWEWLLTFYRTFWMVGIEGHFPLGWLGLTVVLLLSLLAGYGLLQVWRKDARRWPVADRGGSNRDDGDGQSRLILSLLLLHLIAPVILPLLRYAATTSLADTAQGRHVLFMAAPAFAVLLMWGLLETRGWGTGDKDQGPGVRSRVLGFTQHGLRHTSFLVLFPGLWLLCWSLVQLWTMTWAYLPLLPVRTVPEAKAQAVYQLNQPLNDYVTLLGYNRYLDEANQMLRLDLIWQATTVSPFDYLTEVSLLDSQGEAQTQWLGHPASGRYPTRAWDEGDIVRDTVWLSLAGLESGDYQVQLDLRATSITASPESQAQFSMFNFQIPDNGFQESNQDDVPLPDFQVWQAGEPVTMPAMFRYRETVLVTLSPALADRQPVVQIIGPDASQIFAPIREFNHTVLFMVGPDWPTGDYRMQVTLKDGTSMISAPLLQLLDRWERQFDRPPIQHSIEANFANQVKLLGYDLGTNRAEPGGGIPITLYWQGLDWLGYDYTIFTKLLAADQTVHGGRDRLPQEGYRTIYWAPGEIVTDSFGVPVDVAAPVGVYYLNVGLYQEIDGQAISLPLVQEGQPVDASSVNIGPLKIGKAPPHLTLETASPQYPLHQPFGDASNLTLLGYDLADETGQPISNHTLPMGNLQLTLYWRSEAPLPVDYTTFVHLRDVTGQTVAQKDQPPLNGAYPTSLWDPGEIVADEIVIPLPGQLPAGEYRLIVGMYDFNTGQRLTVPGNPENSVLLSELEVKR